MNPNPPPPLPTVSTRLELVRSLQQSDQALVIAGTLLSKDSRELATGLVQFSRCSTEDRFVRATLTPDPPEESGNRDILEATRILVLRDMRVNLSVEVGACPCAGRPKHIHLTVDLQPLMENP